MKRYLVYLLVAAMLAAGAVSVNAAEYEVTLILKDNTSAGWRYLASAAIATGEEIGVKVTENSPLETQNADEQYNLHRAG
jgi:ABC-type sugar transport system substrate-binding protein